MHVWAGGYGGQPGTCRRWVAHSCAIRASATLRALNMSEVVVTHGVRLVVAGR